MMMFTVKVGCDWKEAGNVLLSERILRRLQIDGAFPATTVRGTMARQRTNKNRK